MPKKRTFASGGHVEPGARSAPATRAATESMAVGMQLKDPMRCEIAITDLFRPRMALLNYSVLALLALVQPSVGLRVKIEPSPTSNIVQRRAVVGLAASCLATQLNVAASWSAEEIDAEAAVERIRTEGVLKSTGKPVPPFLPLIVLAGAGAAIASFMFNKPKDDIVVPTGLFPKEKIDDAAYEETKWTNNVDLPWQKAAEEPAPEEAAPADEE